MAWRLVLKILAAMILWGIVGYIVMYVEPAIVRDIAVEGLYLPFLLAVGTAAWYSLFAVSKNWKYASLMAILLVGTLAVMILRWMNILIAIAVVGMAISLSLTLVKRS